MVVAAVLMRAHYGVDALDGEHAICVVGGEHLVPRSLDGARLVHVDVGIGRGNHAFPGAQRGADAKQIRHRASAHELDLKGGAGDIRLAQGALGIAVHDGAADGGACLHAPGVLRVADLLLGVGANERIHHARMRALHIVIAKAMHGNEPFCQGAHAVARHLVCALHYRFARIV